MTSVEFLFLEYHQTLQALRNEFNTKVEKIQNILSENPNTEDFEQSIHDIDLLAEDFHEKMKDLKKSYLKNLDGLKGKQDQKKIEEYMKTL